VPVAVTLKLAWPPTTPVVLDGSMVMSGAPAAPVTVTMALPLVTLPPTLSATA